MSNYFKRRATNAAIESSHEKLKLSRQRIRGVVYKHSSFSKLSNILPNQLFPPINLVSIYVKAYNKKFC